MPSPQHNQQGLSQSLPRRGWQLLHSLSWIQDLPPCLGKGLARDDALEPLPVMPQDSNPALAKALQFVWCSPTAPGLQTPWMFFTLKIKITAGSSRTQGYHHNKQSLT